MLLLYSSDILFACSKDIIEHLGWPYYSYIPETSPHLDWDIIMAHRFAPFHPFQGFSDLQFLNSPHKASVSVVKRVVQLNGGVLVLTIEQFIKILLTSMSGLILL